MAAKCNEGEIVPFLRDVVETQLQKTVRRMKELGCLAAHIVEIL